MHRVDLHILRTARGWFLQNARGESVGVARDPEAALELGQCKAQEWQRRGLDARVILHKPGRPPEMFDFPAEQAPVAQVESYALSRCGL